MSNKMRTAVRDTNGFAKSKLTKDSGTPGVYGRGGGPGFDNYLQDRGPDTIVTKTRETTMGTAKDTTNNLRRATRTDAGGRAKLATTTTMKTSKNKVRSAAKK